MSTKPCRVLSGAQGKIGYTMSAERMGLVKVSVIGILHAGRTLAVRERFPLNLPKRHTH